MARCSAAREWTHGRGLSTVNHMVNLGPRPSRANERELLSAARRAVLDVLLEHHEPMTVPQVAEVLGLHSNTVREHLESLARAQLVTRSQVPSTGRGRPASQYSVNPQTSAGGVEYAVLAEVLVTHLAQAWTREDEQQTNSRAVGRVWGRSMLEREMDRPSGQRGSRRREGTEPEPTEAIRQTFERAGFDPVPDDHEDGSRTLRLQRCPVLALAERHPVVVCNAHLGMVQELALDRGLDPKQVSLKSFAVPGACLLHLNAAATREGPDGTDRSDENAQS